MKWSRCDRQTPTRRFGPIVHDFGRLSPILNEAFYPTEARLSALVRDRGSRIEQWKKNKINLIFKNAVYGILYKRNNTRVMYAIPGKTVITKAVILTPLKKNVITT